MDAPDTVTTQRTLMMEASVPLDKGNSVNTPMATGDDEEAVPAHLSWVTDPQSSFSKFLTIVIIVNALQMGAEKQFSKEDYPALEHIYVALDCAFASIYVVEVSCKMFALRRRFFASSWNWMDLALTLMSVVSVTLTLLGIGAAALKKAKGLRLIRFVRIVRLVRILKGVPELAIVVEGLMRSMVGLFWVMILLGIFTFAYSVFLVEMIGGDEELFGENYFGDMAHAFLTLIDMAILAEWANIARPVMDRQPWLLPFLFAFVLLSSFGMMNVMIGVIVDSTAEAKLGFERDKKTAALDEAVQVWIKGIHDKGLSVEALQKLEDEGNLSAQEKQALHQRRHEEVLKVIQSVIDNGSTDIPAGLTPEDVLSCLDFDGDGVLTRTEFETSFGRLMKGSPYQLTSLILVVLGKVRSKNRMHMHEVHRRFDNLEADMGKRLQAIEQNQQRILKAFDKA